jgi:SpoVK/Ycf46/Vps4 family AAA+-type ATPase
MKKKFGIIKNGIVTDATTGEVITSLFRDIMIEKAEANGQALAFDEETGRARRIETSEVEIDPVADVPKQEVNIEADPVLAFIQDAPKLRPATLEMSDLKWKYLVRSALRSKNIMLVGPAGCGKTEAAKASAKQPIVHFITLISVVHKIQDHLLLVTLTSKMEKQHLISQHS